MQKAELKEFLQIYSKVATAVEGDKEYIYVRYYDRMRKVEITEWSKQLPQFIQEIMEYEENPLFNQIIRESVVLGKSDKKLLAELPISESSYYRYKRKFEEKLYELFIAAGYVSREEILKNKITE